MNLYYARDDAIYYADEEGWRALYWAESPEQAKDMAIAEYDGDIPTQELKIIIEPVILDLVEMLGKSYTYAPGRCLDPYVQRLVGSRDDGEEPCSSCGVWVRGGPYTVCYGCGICKECGCDCNRHRR